MSIRSSLKNLSPLGGRICRSHLHFRKTAKSWTLERTHRLEPQRPKCHGEALVLKCLGGFEKASQETTGCGGLSSQMLG